MSFLARLLSRDYRAALAAEAAGELDAAAAAFVRAGRQADAGRVRRRMADRARALLADDPEPHVREEASRLLESAGEHLAAADVLLGLGRYDAARRCLAAGREFERLEEIDRAEARRRSEAHELREILEAGQALLAEGARDAAQARLEPVADRSAEAAALLGRLRAGRPQGRLLLTVAGAGRPVACAGTLPVLLGRDGTSLLPLADPGVSRQHARIAAVDGRLHLEDLGSRNGVHVDGLCLTGPFELSDGTCFALGERCLVDVRLPAPGAAVLRVERGLAAGARAALVTAPVPLSFLDPALPEDAHLAFEGGWFVLTTPALRLAGREVAGPVQLLSGDRLEVQGLELEVTTP